MGKDIQSATLTLGAIEAGDDLDRFEEVLIGGDAGCAVETFEGGHIPEDAWLGDYFAEHDGLSYEYPTYPET